MEVCLIVYGCVRECSGGMHVFVCIYIGIYKYLGVYMCVYIYVCMYIY